MSFETVTTTEIVAMAGALQERFELKSRDNGQVFTTFDASASDDSLQDSLQEFIQESHGTDIRPDDFRYKIVQDFIDFLAMDADSDASMDEFRDQAMEWSDSAVDICYGDLMTWFTGHASRAELVEAAIRDLGSGYTMEVYLRRAQFEEIFEISSQTLGTLENLCREYQAVWYSAGSHMSGCMPEEDATARFSSKKDAIDFISNEILNDVIDIEEPTNEASTAMQAFESGDLRNRNVNGRVYWINDRDITIVEK